MKTKYILATHSDYPNGSCYKIWLPLNFAVYDLDINGIIWTVYGPNGGPASYYNTLCDVNTHEKCVELDKLGARNPLELMMKLDLYPNLFLEI